MQIFSVASVSSAVKTIGLEFLNFSKVHNQKSYLRRLPLRLWRSGLAAGGSLAGVVYIMLYFASVLAAPVLLIAAGILYAVGKLLRGRRSPEGRQPMSTGD